MLIQAMPDEDPMKSKIAHGRIEPDHKTNLVSEGALIKRINRRLSSQQNYEVLKKARGRRYWSDLGDFYLLDWNHRAIIQGHVDIEMQGRELGVLADHEQLAVAQNTEENPAF